MARARASAAAAGGFELQLLVLPAALAPLTIMLHATPRSTVKASTTCWSCLRPTLPDWRRACADHHHHRAANLYHGSYRASEYVGCALGNSQVAPRTHKPCSVCMHVRVCRDGTLLPVQHVCVSSYRPESWYLGRSTSGDNSVIAAGIPERFLIIREAPGHGDPCGRKRVKQGAQWKRQARFGLWKGGR